jgi:predicted transposase/invertase (TIGR01784 family)
LSSFEHIPTILNEPLFQKAFDILETAHLNPEQFETYQKSLYSYWEVNSAIDTARKDGLEQGLEQGDKQAREAIARNLLGVLDVETIALKTGLSVEQIQLLTTD